MRCDTSKIHDIHIVIQLISTIDKPDLRKETHCTDYFKNKNEKRIIKLEDRKENMIKYLLSKLLLLAIEIYTYHKNVDGKINSVITSVKLSLPLLSFNNFDMKVVSGIFPC